MTPQWVARLAHLAAHLACQPSDSTLPIHFEADYNDQPKGTNTIRKERNDFRLSPVSSVTSGWP
jgi:hypothetical protein